MAFQPVPDTASVRFVLSGVAGGAVEGCEAIWTWHVRDTVVGFASASALQSLATYAEDWWETGQAGGAAAKTLFHADWRLDRVVTTNLDVANGLAVSEGVGTVGTRAGTVVPPNCPALVQFRGDGGGTPMAARSFLPAGVEADLNGNSFATTFRNDLQGVVDDFVSDLGNTVASWAFVIVSRYSGTEPVQKTRAVRRATAMTNTLDFVGVRQEVASQRDRRASVG